MRPDSRMPNTDGEVMRLARVCINAPVHCAHLDRRGGSAVSTVSSPSAPVVGRHQLCQNQRELSPRLTLRTLRPGPAVTAPVSATVSSCQTSLTFAKDTGCEEFSRWGKHKSISPKLEFSLIIQAQCGFTGFIPGPVIGIS